MQTRYEVGVKKLSAVINDYEWETYLTTTKKNKAIKEAKNLSLKNIEADVIGIKDGDVVHHSFYSNGKFTNKTF